MTLRFCAIAILDRHICHTSCRKEAKSGVIFASQEYGREVAREMNVGLGTWRKL